MFDLIRSKVVKIARVLREDESKPLPAELLIGKRGTKYQHAVVRFVLPDGWHLKYNWMAPGMDAPDCTHNLPHWGEGDHRVFIEVGIRKLLEDKEI